MREIHDKILASAYERDGKLRIDCATAFAIAAHFAIEKTVVRDICDELNIKIANCQLRCFS